MIAAGTGAALVALFAVGLVVAAATDLDRLEIPNSLNLGLCGLVLAMLGVAVLDGHLAPETAVWHLAAGLGLLLLGFIVFTFRIIGGGDAKLLAILALAAGPGELSRLVLSGAVGGGLFTLILIAYRRLPLPGPVARLRWVARHHVAGAPVPYAVPLVATALWLLPGLPLIRAVAGWGP